MNTTGSPTNAIAERLARELTTDRDEGALPLRVAVVAATWHEAVTDGLLAGSEKALGQLGITPRVVRVPGSFELPVAAARLAPAYDAVVALGVVLQDGSPQFEHLSRAAVQGLMDVSVTTGTPVGLGLLTCEDEKQALDRAGLEGSSRDTGADAALSAVDTAASLRRARATARR